MTWPVYAPKRDEEPCVTDAINLWVQVVESDRAADAGLRRPGDVHIGQINQYVHGVANTMACMDVWSDHPADDDLWAASARLNGAGPGIEGAYRYARAAAWRDYIYQAATAKARVIA